GILQGQIGDNLRAQRICQIDDQYGVFSWRRHDGLAVYKRCLLVIADDHERSRPSDVKAEHDTDDGDEPQRHELKAHGYLPVGLSRVLTGPWCDLCALAAAPQVGCRQCSSVFQGMTLRSIS